MIGKCTLWSQCGTCKARLCLPTVTAGHMLQEKACVQFVKRETVLFVLQHTQVHLHSVSGHRRLAHERELLKARKHLIVVVISEPQNCGGWGKILNFGSMACRFDIEGSLSMCVLCVNMYTCMFMRYAKVCVCVLVLTHVFTCYVQVCIHTRVHVMCACTHMHLCVCMGVHTLCAHTREFVCMHVCAWFFTC